MSERRGHIARIRVFAPSALIEGRAAACASCVGLGFFIAMTERGDLLGCRNEIITFGTTSSFRMTGGRACRLQLFDIGDVVSRPARAIRLFIIIAKTVLASIFCILTI